MKTARLIRATLQGTTWLSADGLRDLVRKGRLWIVILAALGILAGVATSVFMLVGVYRALLAFGPPNGQPALLLFSALLGSGLFTFVTAIPLALSLLYYSRDLAMLLALPLRPRSIVAAKSFLLYLYCIPVHLVVFVPALCLQAAATGVSAAASLGAVSALLLYPLLPISLAVLLALALMKTVNLSRYRSVLETAGMGLGIILAIAFQVVLSRYALAAFTGGAAAPLAGFLGFFSGMRRALPPLVWAADAMLAGAGAWTLLLSALAPVALAAAATAAASGGFAQDVMERWEVSRSPRHASSRLRQGEARGVLHTLLGREWAVLTSNSTFIFQVAGELLVLPLLLAIYGLVIPRQFLLPALAAINGKPFLPLALTGVIALMTGLTTLSSSSLSREGKGFGISLTMPVAGRTQVSAKVLLHLFLFGSACLLDCAIAWWLFRFPLVSLVFMLPVGFAVQVLSSCVGILVDLKRPILGWTHPQQAMKNNMNVMVGIGGSAGVVIVTAALCAMLVLARVDPLLVGCAAAVVLAGAAALLLPRVLAYADRQYSGGLETGG